MAANKMQLEDWLDDLCVRFIINLPEEDLSSVARICFQIEEAQWFYEDFVRPLDPALPSMTLRNFSLRIFQHCPLLAPFSVENHTRAFEEFLQYKTRIPVRGAILLNEAMDSTVLVKGWKKGANWSFPRGKINKDEDDLECAIREVYEETGYDLHAAGLVPPSREVKHIEITMREQQMRLYVFRDVPMDTHFAPRTRKEISKIQWYNLSELPAFRKKGNNHNDAAAAAAAANANKFYMVAPFLVPLKKWVVQQKKRDGARNTQQQVHFQPQNLYDEPVTEDDAWTHTEPTASVVEHTPALDTLEGATKELQRLLKVQPTTQGLQMSSPPEANKDKGASLLAILQANSRARPIEAAVQVPHTPIEHVVSEATEPSRPHHQHHSQHRVPLPNSQAPPNFPLGTDSPHSYSPRYQLSVVAGPGQGHLHQPSHLNAPSPQTAMQTRSPSNVYLPGREMLGQPGATRDGYPRPEAHAQYAQSFAPISKPPPTQLTNHSMALLGVLKSGSKSPNPAMSGNGQQPQAAPTTVGQAQTHQSTNIHQGQYQSLPAFWQQEVSRPAQGGAARNSAGTDQHRSALLQMFKKPEASISPSPEKVNVAGNVNPSQTAASGLNNAQGAGSFSHGARPFASQAVTQPTGQALPAHQPARADASSLGHAHTIGAPTSTPPFTILKRPEVMGRSPVPRQAPMNAAVAAHNVVGQDKPSSLASPPSTSSFPTPAGLQGKQPMSHEQRHKLLSLFGKPQPTSPGVLEPVGKGQDIPVRGPSSRSGSAAGKGLPFLGQISPEGIAESRRGSQTPISPADRNFLLSYLASATNNTN